MRFIKTFKENKSGEDEEEYKDVLNIVSSVGDACKSYKFFKIKRSPQLKFAGYGMLLYIADSGFISNNSQMMTKNLSTVIEEIVDASSRLSEIGFYTLMNFKHYGMTLGIYRKEDWDDKVNKTSPIFRVDTNLNESILDFVKKNPVSPEIVQRILNMSNSQDFRKNNIVISKYAPKVSSMSDKAALNNVSCFKVTFPEDCEFLEYPTNKSNEIYIFVRRAKNKKHRSSDGSPSEHTNKYLIESNFYGHFMSLDDGTLRSIYEYTEEELIRYFERLVDRKEKLDIDKKRKIELESKAKKFEKKFDADYIKNIFADLISLLPDTHTSYSNSTWCIISKSNVKVRENSGRGVEYIIDDKMSEILELMSISSNRLKDDGLIMSFQFQFQHGVLNESRSNYLYIYIREESKKQQFFGE